MNNDGTKKGMERAPQKKTRHRTSSRDEIKPGLPETRFYYVYRITCHHPQAGAKYYYGSRTLTRAPEDDTAYWSSSRRLRASRQRLGAAWFTKKIIARYQSLEKALAKEIDLHTRFDVKTHPLFFNLANQTSTRFTTAGKGRIVSQATREKIARALKGVAKSAETRANMARAIPSRRGVSMETRQKMSQAKRAMSDETRAKMSHTHLGVGKSAETRAKMSQAHLGKPLSPETRAKMSKSRQGKTHSLETREKIAQALPLWAQASGQESQKGLH